MSGDGGGALGYTVRQEEAPNRHNAEEETMSTQYLGVEELIARQQNGFMDRSVRHTWRLTDFWRERDRTQHVSQRTSVGGAATWPRELVELGRMQLRWAML